MSTASGARWTPPLALVTGSLDRVWQVLELGHHVYPAARWALMWQESWEPGEHLTYWQTHLGMWPRSSHRVTSTGLKAQHAATWLAEGYSRSQVARALGYVTAPNVPKSLWLLAYDYRVWLHDQPLRLGGGVGAVQFFEDSYAAGVDESLRATAPMYNLTDDPELLASDDPSIPKAERARRYVRRRWRTPRVIPAADADTPRHRFGWPEPISTAQLYPPAELANIERADSELHEHRPYHGEREGARRLAITTRQFAARSQHRAA